MVGREILVRLQGLGAGKPVNVLLLGVEDSGIWIESQDITDTLLDSMNTPALKKTMVVFIPWQGVICIYEFLDGPSLSRKAFGLEES
jgi:hypothetical protein